MLRLLQGATDFCKALFLERKSTLASLVNQNIFSILMPILFCLWAILGPANTSLRTLIVFTVIRLRKANLFDGPPTPLFCWAVRTSCHVSNKRQWAFKTMVEWPNFLIKHLGSLKTWQGKHSSIYTFFGNTGLRPWRGGRGGEGGGQSPKLSETW